MTRLNVLARTIIAMAYANDVDAFIPEVWAQESLMILEANLVLGNLVHRDFENEIQQFGDVVNTRRPAKFTAKRKNVNSSVTIQDATATNVPIKLDQQIHTSFLIRDGEESKSMKSLVQEYLYPAVLSLARRIDETIAAQFYQFLPNAVGTLATDIDRTTLVAAREKLNALYCPDMPGERNLIITPNMEGALLNDINFLNAEKNMTDSAVKNGQLIRKLGFDIIMSQIAPSIAAGNTTTTGAINAAGGYPIGATALTVNGFAAAIANGAWVQIGGRPYLVTATVGGATPTQITIAGGLTKAVANATPVVHYVAGAINLGAGYAAGFDEDLVIDGFTVAPKAAQGISVGGTIYGAVGVPSLTGIALDRPLDAAAADNAIVGVAPAGEYGFAFHRNAIALVTRPLATPKPGTGARSFVANFNGLSLRITITYNGEKQGHLVTVDILGGIKVLDQNLGVPVLG
jgi:hypothetical protein